MSLTDSNAWRIRQNRPWTPADEPKYPLDMIRQFVLNAAGSAGWRHESHILRVVAPHFGWKEFSELDPQDQAAARTELSGLVSSGRLVGIEDQEGSKMYRLASVQTKAAAVKEDRTEDFAALGRALAKPAITPEIPTAPAERRSRFVDLEYCTEEEEETRKVAREEAIEAQQSKESAEKKARETTRRTVQTRPKAPIVCVPRNRFEDIEYRTKTEESERKTSKGARDSRYKLIRPRAEPGGG